jgi:hypothetical protein
MEPPVVELRDEHLEPLRRYLLGDMDGLDVFEGDPEDAAVRGSWLLFVAGFSVAVRRRFGDSFSRKDIIEFVADLRISLGKDRDDLDPKVAEDWIRSVLGNLPNEEQLRVHDNPELSGIATFLTLERLRDTDVIDVTRLDEFLQESMDYARHMQERLPDIWEEIRPFVEDHVPDRLPTPPVEVLFDR